MSFNWADDTDEAIAAGELPEFAGCKTMLFNFLGDITEIQVDVGEMISCGTSLLRCLFYKKWGMQNMGMETAERERISDDEMEEKEKEEAMLWPGRGKWRVKRKSPLRMVMFA
ncbi:hypothetical protein EAF04_004974 [Stromatinia cepivora]|nr:hypothetical protein EAF04_004974 [Stromatinia cepivora]